MQMRNPECGICVTKWVDPPDKMQAFVLWAVRMRCSLHRVGIFSRDYKPCDATATQIVERFTLCFVLLENSVCNSLKRVRWFYTVAGEIKRWVIQHCHSETPSNLSAFLPDPPAWALLSWHMPFIWRQTAIPYDTSHLSHPFHFRMNIFYNITFHLIVCEDLCPWGFFRPELCNNHTVKTAAANIHHSLLCYDPV